MNAHRHERMRVKLLRATGEEARARARGRCECLGECGTAHPGEYRRCTNHHGDVLVLPVRRIVHLALGYLDGNRENVAVENLRVYCPVCFNNHAARVQEPAHVPAMEVSCG